MLLAIALLLLILLVFGLGFAFKALLWVALILFALWVVGWLVGGVGASTNGGSRRWYYW